MTIKLSITVEPVDETVNVVLVHEEERGGSGNYEEVARQSLHVTREVTSRVFSLEPGKSKDRMLLTLEPGKPIVYDAAQGVVKLG